MLVSAECVAYAINLGGTTGIFLPSHLWTGGFCFEEQRIED